MLEEWEPLCGKSLAGYEVSNRGRVRGRLGVLIPTDVRSLEKGRPAVMIGGTLRLIRTLVAHTFGEDEGDLAALLVLGEDVLLKRRADLEDQLDQLDEAIRICRLPLVADVGHAAVREIEDGEDISAWADGPPQGQAPDAIAREEARHLGSIYRSGITVDPGSRLTRQEVATRLIRLRNVFGPMIEQVSQVPLPLA